MQIIKDKKSLAAAIAELENKKSAEASLLKNHFDFTVHNLNPINMVKEKFNEVIHAPGLKGKIASTAINLATGYFTNSLIVGSSVNPIKRMIASFVQSKVSNLAIDTEDVKEKSLSMLSNTLQKLKIK